MSWTVVYSSLISSGLTPGSVIAMCSSYKWWTLRIISRGENKQCSSIEERENASN